MVLVTRFLGCLGQSARAVLGACEAAEFSRRPRTGLSADVLRLVRACVRVPVRKRKRER